MNKIEKAERCERLINDPDLKAAFEAVKQQFIKAILEASNDDDDGVMDCKKCIHLLELVEQDLHKAIRAGKLEQYEEPPFLGAVGK